MAKADEKEAEPKRRSWAEAINDTVDEVVETVTPPRPSTVAAVYEEAKGSLPRWPSHRMEEADLPAGSPLSAGAKVGEGVRNAAVKGGEALVGMAKDAARPVVRGVADSLNKYGIPLPPSWVVADTAFRAAWDDLEWNEEEILEDARRTREQNMARIRAPGATRSDPHSGKMEMAISAMKE